MRQLLSQNLQKMIAEKTKQPKKVTELCCLKCRRKYELYEYDDQPPVKLGCDCEMIRMGIEANERNKQLIKKRKIEKLFNRSIVSPDIKGATFETYKPITESQKKALYVSQRYADRFTLDNPQSLMFQGTFGTGKSHLAMSILKEVKEKGYSVVFMDVPQLITMIFDTYNKTVHETESEILELIASADLVVLDDIGVHVSQNGMAKLFQVLQGRLGKHTIYTTNLDQEELTANKDWQRLYSRISTAYPIIIEGQDHRHWRNKIND